MLVMVVEVLADGLMERVVEMVVVVVGWVDGVMEMVVEMVMVELAIVVVRSIGM